MLPRETQVISSSEPTHTAQMPRGILPVPVVPACAYTWNTPEQLVAASHLVYVKRWSREVVKHVGAKAPALRKMLVALDCQRWAAVDLVARQTAELGAAADIAEAHALTAAAIRRDDLAQRFSMRLQAGPNTVVGPFASPIRRVKPWRWWRCLSGARGRQLTCTLTRSQARR